MHFGMAFLQDHFKITEDEGGKLACFSTGPCHQKYFLILFQNL